MNIEEIREICLQLPSVTEDIKWEKDLCFLVGGKMFLVVVLDQLPTSASFKVAEEDFEAICWQEGFIPAPYLARAKWVQIADIQLINHQEWKNYIAQSYRLIKEKLPKKVKAELESSQEK
jgi:predicted DNA-binding protein (MmcQ/YjbR family)